MDMLVVEGGRPLRGTVAVSGAKNAALPILAATLAIPGQTRLQNVPQLRDTTSMLELLTQLGMRITRTSNNDLLLETVDESPNVADYELVRKMRASVCVLGPLLARRGRAVVSLPGGCNIGHRPIDLHLKGLAALGADISIKNGYVVATAENLRGADIYLGGPRGSTATGTCNVMLAAVFADGITRIEAAACEPEVVDLANFLNAAGARISGHGTNTLTIEGVRELRAVTHEIIPDRIEAATWLIAAAITAGDVTVENANPADMTSILGQLRKAGISVETNGRSLRVAHTGRANACDLTALPHPGLPTDVQAQWTSLMCLADGPSVVTDQVFPDRFMHAAELLRMGADIRQEGNSVIVQGVEKLSAASVMASDLRASAALILAALAAEGTSTIRRIYHLDRGYERLAEKLTTLGANVERVRDEQGPAGTPLPQPHWSRTPDHARKPFEA
ncbi:UDP-N-acetylglucosamine 1-carboxyvinyltransferase [Rubinisphaera sp. JC750]|uniref:UDP-N-acetylglucosamine 1-carboxyvinyltransferase n=1 Tax=Rubinisphaera sp. JC750 TaxID=2898658 RepID=UPI001F000C28|nr:UDP-N-acetylglucosamine 1-carboxyvinyltransferase [Rubinisphaera sp. JC750]